MKLQNKTNEELAQMMSEIQSEVKSRVPNPECRYSFTWASYNPRRFSKPWIAKITAWPVGGKPVIEFGGYCGDEDGGETEIIAQPGNILRSGQKDNRSGSTVNEWYLAKTDGKVKEINAAQARKLYKEGVV